MISKWKMEMLTFLTSLTLVSVGFSSWQVSIPNDSELSATVGVDSVVHTDNFVSLVTPTLFEYNAEDSENPFFVTYDTKGEPSSTNNVANFELTYNLDLAKCKSEGSPFLSYYENETDFGYYGNGVITCIISFNSSNQTDINFFDTNAITTSTGDKPNPSINTAETTLNDRPLNTPNHPLGFESSIARYNETAFKLELKFLIEQTFKEGETANKEIIPIVCKFNFEIKNEKMDGVCKSLANGGNFTFHTTLSGE